MSETPFQPDLDLSDPQIQRALQEASDFWDLYYFDEEKYRSIHEPEVVISTRLEQKYFTLNPETAFALGYIAREEIIKQLNN